MQAVGLSPPAQRSHGIDTLHVEVIATRQYQWKH